LKKNSCVSSHSNIDESHTLGRQEIDAGDLETLDALLPANAGERKTLADLIFAKLDSKELTSNAAIQKVHQGGYFAQTSNAHLIQIGTFIDRNAPDPAAGLNPQVVEAYSKFICFLSHIYRRLHVFILDLVYYCVPTSPDLCPSFSK
jgi:hypothetical protein